MLVFDDAVKYKKGLFGKEKQLIITPTDYKIKLKKLLTEAVIQFGFCSWIKKTKGCSRINYVRALQMSRKMPCATLVVALLIANRY